MTAAPTTTSPIVLVQHGNGPRAALDRLLAETRRPVIRVHIDRGRGQHVDDLGEAHEFSGYQEGLALALQQVPAAASTAMADAPTSITFVNDTLASGHPRSVARALLVALAPRQATAASGPHIVGLRMPMNAAVESVSGTPGYLSSWAFTLTAPVALLQQVRFYGPNEQRSSFAATWATLPQPYRDWVDAWLAPVHWLRGWYKASPGRPLDEATRQRKRLAIYLEHTLPRRLAALGFEALDASDGASPLQRQRLRVLRSLDRLHVNRLKLAHRLPHLLRQKT